MRTLFSTYSQKDIESNIKKISALLGNRTSDNQIIEKNRIEFIEELLSIAKARKRANESKSKYLDLPYFNEEDLRFSTPKEIADYRAKKLKCKRIVDLCSGIGSQAVSFSKFCKEVLAIEIDERKVEYAKSNDKGKKVKFLCGDALSSKIIQEVKEFNPDIIFCDPERLEEEKERSLNSIVPDIKKLVEVYLKISPNLCIELPPQIQSEKLKELGDFEAEYLSYNNKLNRLDLYFGNLKKAEVSVSDIFGIRIEKGNNSLKPKYSPLPLKYIYEVSPAIIKSALENEFSYKINADIIVNDKHKLLLTSNELNKCQESKAFSKIYKVLGYSDNLKQTIKILIENKIGKVVLKKNIPPENYWSERKKYEIYLKGKKEASLFSMNFNNKSLEIVAETLDTNNQ